MTRKIVESTFVTLDGVISDPQIWGSSYWDEQHTNYATKLLEPADVLLLGRATYDAFAASWPERSGDPYSDKLNSMPKYVASRTLTDASWNTAVLDTPIETSIAALKEQTGGDILKFGTGELSRTLLDQRLVDEYHFWVFPVVAGTGARLFDGADVAHLELVNTTRFDSGIVVLTLTPPAP